MTGKVKVTPELLKQQAQVYRQTATSIEQEISKLRTANQRLSEIWLGQAAASFIETFESLMPQMQKLKEHLEAIYQKILAYANQMAGRDQADAGKFMAKFDLLADLNPLSVEKTASTLQAARAIDQQIKDKKVTEKSEQAKKLKRQQMENQAALKELGANTLENSGIHLDTDQNGKITGYGLNTSTVLDNLAGGVLGGAAVGRAGSEGVNQNRRRGVAPDYSGLGQGLSQEQEKIFDANESVPTSPYGKGGTPNE